MKKLSLREILRWLVPKLWLLGCLIGTLLQSIQVSDVYFSYVTVTLTNVYHPTIYNQPQVSFCFPIILLINWQDVIDNYPNIISDMEFEGLSPDEIRKEVEKIPYLSVRRKRQAKFTNGRESWLVNNLTFFANDLITKCYLLNNETYLINEVDCWEKFHCTAFFKEDQICYGFSNQMIYEYFFVMKVLGSNGFIQSFDLNHIIRSRAMSLSYFISRNVDDIPFHGSGFAKKLSLTNYKDYSMIADRYLNKYLPPPYDTNCRDYDLSNFRSKDDCFESCERNRTIAKYEALIPGPTFDTKNEKLMKLNMRAVSDMKPEEGDQIEMIESFCSGACAQVECVENIMVPVTKSVNPRDRLMKITVGVPTAPAKVAQFVPNLSLTSYIVQLGSIIGFWTGLSLFHIYELIEGMIRHFIEKRKQSQ